MRKSSNCEVLVVGAGPVGLTAALEFARRGHTVRIIDKGEGFTPVDESRALAVNNRSLQLLGPSKVATALLAEGHKVLKLRVENETGRSVVRSGFSKAGALYPFMLVVRQGMTERLLARALSDLGVKVEWNAEAMASNRNAEEPSIDVNWPASIETIRAEILVGADGVGSLVREEFGFSFDGEAYDAEFGLADLELENPGDESEIVARFTRNGALGAIPMGDKIVRFVSPRPDVSEALPDDIKIRRVIWRSSFHVSFRHVETMQKKAVFLVGDAAHVHSPAGGRGMNLGIEDAAWLAWLISEERREEYSGLRLPEVRKVIAQTKQQTNGLLHMNFLARIVRDYLANAALKIPSLRRAAFQRLTGLDTADPPWL